MNQNFFFWYYTKGLIAASVLLAHLVRYVFHRFNLVSLAATLVSPWKNDVTMRNWLGFHPLQFVQTLFENLISRFLGMLVRLVVIGVGAICLVGAVLLGLGMFSFYILAPALFVIGLVFIVKNPIFGLWLLGTAGLGLLGAALGFFLRQDTSGLTTDITLLRHKRWFGTLLGRLSLERKSLDRSLLKNTESFVQFLAEKGITRDVYEKAVALEYQADQKRFEERRMLSWENLRKSARIGRGWQYGFTSHLDRYVLDLSIADPTGYAHRTPVGKEEAFQMMTLALARPTENNVLLVGDPGIGKKTLIHTLARQIRENAFEGGPLGDARVLVFDMGRAVSDALNNGGDGEGVLRSLLSEAVSAQNVILVVENIDTFVGAEQSRHNVAAVLGEFLAFPRFRLIATTTTAHYHAMTKTDEQLLKFFETIHLRETTEDETLEVLLEYARSKERKKVLFSLPGLLALIDQSSRYKWEVPMPERVLDLAEETLLYAVEHGTESIIGPQTVDAFLSLKTGMPTGTIGADEKEKLLRLEEYLHERVIGQDEAVRQVAESMRKARAGFGDAKRPLGSFIFLGPTGVGKTETVKAFAESYFGSEDRMIRLDMSEYQTPEAVARLIGSDALDIPGQLTDLVKEKPFSIVLLDELEKAYPKALDLFLQVLDEGYLTDGFGEKVSFRNTIIIATSNAGAAIIRDGMAAGIPFDTIKKQVMDFIVDQGIYRLEFMNRFDGVVFFEPLKPAELLAVATMKLQQFANRLLKEKNITIVFAPGVAEKIVTEGYVSEFGARSLNRYIEDTIEDAVVNQIIAGEAVSGGTLTVTPDQLEKIL